MTNRILAAHGSSQSRLKTSFQRGFQGYPNLEPRPDARSALPLPTAVAAQGRARPADPWRGPPSPPDGTAGSCV